MCYAMATDSLLYCLDHAELKITQNAVLRKTVPSFVYGFDMGEAKADHVWRGLDLFRHKKL